MVDLLPDVVEHTLFEQKPGFAFQIPPRRNDGHKAADWPKEAMFTGRVRILEVGEKVKIVLDKKVDKEGDEDEGEFLTYMMDPENDIESAIDSSRYFALKMKNPQGRNFYIGIGFQDRNEASNFRSALQDYGRHKKALAAPPKNFEDLALKPGQMLQLKKLPTKSSEDNNGADNGFDDEGWSSQSSSSSKKKKKKKSSSSRASSSSSGSEGGGGLFALAPPPGDSKKRKKKKKQKEHS